MPVDTYQYQLPLHEQNRGRMGDNALGQYPHPAFEAEQQTPLMARDIEEQATPESVREAEIDLFDDRTNLNYLQDAYTQPNGHGSITPAEIEVQKTSVYTNEIDYHEIYKLQSTEQIAKGISMTGKYMATMRPIVLDEADKRG